MAGQEISLPLYLYSPTGTKVGQLAMELTFPVPLLTFVRTETAYPAERAGAKMSTEVVESKARVQVAVPSDSKEGLPQGSIAFFVFKVSDDAPGGKLGVVAENIGMKDLNGQPLPSAEKSEGQIDVIPKEMESLFACFFYMH
ncbi:MAG: hypothetical protein HYX74_00605 [Acidobacteria bacterium]|nr:hypothetical protein [Acidobacteriota bacterium]